MSETFDSRGPKERAYDDLISPLMSQIIQACKDNGINVVAGFELDFTEDKQDHLFCTTRVVNEGASDRMKRLSLASAPARAEFAAFTITTNVKP
jgi:hypothetical protein